MSRLLLRACPLLLAALVLAGCGSAEPAKHAEPGPNDAFCAAAKHLDAVSGDWKQAQQAAVAWRRAGLPKDAPANVRRGFALGITLIVSSSNEKQVDRRVRELSPIQHDDLSSVDSYLADTCPASTGG